MTPGLLISAPSSGAGKTTMTLGLLRAFADDGVSVQPFKSGPDYIDPAFHHAACGQPCYNLDSWAMGSDLVAAIAAKGARAELVIAEGAMGLYDGAENPGASGQGSSAELAVHMGLPVVLVVDVAKQAQSAAAVALGCATLNPNLPFAGVVLNRVASARHERLVRAGMKAAGLPVLGALPRRDGLSLPSRHLGLVQAMEHPDLEQTIAAAADTVREYCDLDALRASAKASPQAAARNPLEPPAQRIALAQDEAFSFLYPHLLDAWRLAGAEIVPFSPLADEAPDPSADLVWLPGGYPELHAGRLAAADRFLDGLRRHAKTRPIHGECGGYMVLGEALIDEHGNRHAMAGLLGLVTSYQERRLHLGYRQAELLAAMPGFPAGATLRGHEYHHCSIIAQPDATLASITDASGNMVSETGSYRDQVTGTFFHLIAPGE
ncbi:MAG: cobyrinate a,c-diamide synthase [Hyphomicrobiales bacterium]